MLLRAGLALLGAGRKAWEKAGGDKAQPNPADPYMTVLGYFNSLRELGGSRRIIEDEVRTRLAEYGRRRRLAPADDLFASREITYDVRELTSRVSTNDVAIAKRRLDLGFALKEHVDVALATNMISVGLDTGGCDTRAACAHAFGCETTFRGCLRRQSRPPSESARTAVFLQLHRSARALDGAGPHA